MAKWIHHTDVEPKVDDTHDLGSPTKRFAEVHGNKIFAVTQNSSGANTATVINGSHLVSGTVNANAAHDASLISNFACVAIGDVTSKQHEAIMQSGAGSGSSGCFTTGFAYSGSMVNAAQASFMSGSAYAQDDYIVVHRPEMHSSGHGGFCQGFAYAYSDDGEYGPLATRGCLIEVTGQGGFAQGSTYNGGRIIASANGAFAQGRANPNVSITASGVGSFAHGNANTNDITAGSGAGAFAVGDSTTGAITSSAVNSAQFFPGVNSITLSIQIGSGISLRAAGNILMAETTAVTSVAGFGQTYMKNVGGTTEFWFVNDIGGAAKII